MIASAATRPRGNPFATSPGRVLFLSLTGALLLAAPVSANHLDARDQKAVHLAVLAYHPFPDASGDPYGLPHHEGDREGDWMSLRYGAYWFPTAAVDGVTVLERTPRGEGGGPYLETYASYQRAYKDRVVLDTPFTLRVTGQVDGNAIRIDVEATTSTPLDETDLLLYVAIFEDDVDFDGGNGVTHHRFVVRAVPEGRALPLGGGPASEHYEFPLNQSWKPARLGAAAWVANEADTSLRFERHEVLQAAVWKHGQVGPTIQVHKAVLFELYTATWCLACPPADAAIDELSNQLGLASARREQGGLAYLRPGDAWTLAVAVAVGLLVSFAMRGRPQKPGAPPEVTP